MFAEGLSWFTAGGLGPCLIEPEHSQQAADDNGHKDCPTFFAGMLLSFERGFEWIKRDDNDKAVVAGFTIVLAISTIGLWFATNRLWAAGERQLTLLGETSAAQSRDMQASIAAAQQSANAAQMQAAIMVAVEGPIPLVVEIKLAQYANIPGENLITDPLPPGPIQPNCRILFAIENKGRTPLRLVELCIEKHVGRALPDVPTYTHKTPWGLVLEKGPIWIRGTDGQIEITPAEVGQTKAVYASGGAFWVYGYLAYLDLLNQRAEHKFLVRWELRTGFVPDNRAGYT